MRIVKYWVLWKLGAACYPEEKHLWIWYRGAYKVAREDLNIRSRVYRTWRMIRDRSDIALEFKIKALLNIWK